MRLADRQEMPGRSGERSAASSAQYRENGRAFQDAWYRRTIWRRHALCMSGSTPVVTLERPHPVWQAPSGGEL